MKQRGRLVAVDLFITVTFFVATGCGSMNSPSNRVLESMSITPATADASSSPNGQVQFTATGEFNKPPTPATVPFVAPYSGSWESSDPTIATVNQSGVAHCVPGASGTVTIKAIASANSAGPGQMSIAVSATAKLTCP